MNNYCSNCGYDVIGKKYCSNCGTKNNEDSDFIRKLEVSSNLMFTPHPGTGEVSDIPDKIFPWRDGTELHIFGHNSAVYRNGKMLWMTLGTQ